MFDEKGTVSLYLILIIVPIFLFCTVFIDYARVKAAEKESEQAVKTALRSTLSAFSVPLHDYGLYALDPSLADSSEIYRKTLENNLSGQLETSSFRYIDTRLADGSDRLLPMYSLANHQVLRQQILEEMKYRAPIIFGLELKDKFMSSGISSKLQSTVQFADHAQKVEQLLDERDEALDEAWSYFEKMHLKAGTDYPFYETNLNALHELSGKVGIHTADEVRKTIADGKQQLERLKDQIEGIDDSINSLARAGAAYEAFQSLLETRGKLSAQVSELSAKITEWEQLLKDVLEYVKLLAALKLKSASDYTVLAGYLEDYNTALNKAKRANEALNAELKLVASEQSGGSMASNEVFKSIYTISPQDLDDYASQTAAVAALFGGLKSQLQAVVFFTAENYTSTSGANSQYYTSANALYGQQNGKETARNRNKGAVSSGKKEQRNKAHPALDQAVKAMGGCSVLAPDALGTVYNELQRNYGAYMDTNKAMPGVDAVGGMKFDKLDNAGTGALALIDKLGELLVSARDYMFINEYALDKFNYRTFGIEKDQAGNIKPSRSLSDPSSHALPSQEAEYVIYGSSSCAGNYGRAYAELFAIRLAIGTMEALTDPAIEALNLGSPVLVLLAALAEGAVKAALDMVKLLDGETVPLSNKFTKNITLTYKDYLRLFLLLHGSEQEKMARMQALIQQNTGDDLKKKTTYVQGSATTTVRLWFIPGLMQMVKSIGVHDCTPAGNRCEITKTAYMAY
ncbi:hypothetical protein [Paenibacillus thalictri]|uniref:hypothetical protein n=1 Tax=Paenibacillus thalictri TaxID=2527873 RepID=UPI0013EF0602|nr:hypothetical protein [Paenibacillus thalictri]